MDKKDKVVLVGGCFDVLHPGHIIFLKKAKKLGRLIVFLESDQKIRQLKGQGRPIFNQKERRAVLEALRFVDQVIELPDIKKEADYDELVKKFKPDFIATTFGDPQIAYKKRAAKLVGAKVKVVTKRMGNYSSTKVLKPKTWG